MNWEDNYCGCGKPVRYMRPDGKGACNKYARCPTYDELSKNSADLFEDLLLTIQSANAMRVYREGTDFYNEAEIELKKITEKYKLVP